jgi:ABC-type antimicrobial peptide transport system permease subunit
MRRSLKYPFFFLFPLIIIPLNLSNSYFPKNISEMPEFDYITPIIDAINMTEIEKYVEVFSSFGTRFTGYQGNLEAAKYLYDEFRKYLQNVSYFPFNVTLPIDEGAFVEFSSGERIPLYPLLPNLVCPPQTPSDGILGKLVYVGDGEYCDFDNKEIENSIVVMDFNSGYHWLTAANLGAKAVIFIEPQDTSFDEANKKLVSVAFNFPRLYVRYKDAYKILENVGSEVKLISNMKIKTVTAYNVLGFLPGKTEKSILLTAHYDSFSWIPSVSPGARESIGISVLLQLAKFFSYHPNLHYYTLVFIAFSGSNQGCKGSIWFAKKMIQENWDHFGKNIVFQINIAIMDGYPQLQPAVTGGLTNWLDYSPWSESLRYWYFSLLKSDMASKMNMPEIKSTQYLDDVCKMESLTMDLLATTVGTVHVSHWDLLGEPMMFLDHEPLRALGGPSISFIDYKSFHKYYGTPCDISSNIFWDFVEYKLKIMYPLILATVNTDLIAKKIMWEPGVDWKPQLDAPIITGGQRWPVWIDTVGEFVQYNFSTGWYSPVPNVLVAYRNALRGELFALGTESPPPAMGLWNLWEYAYTDEKGLIYLPCTAIGEMQAYVVDQTTGNVIYAPAFGLHSFPNEILDVRFKSVVQVNARLMSKVGGVTFSFSKYTLQPVGTIILFNVGDVYYRNTPRDTQLMLIPMSALSKSEIEDYSWTHFLDGKYGIGVAALYVPVNEPVSIISKCVWTGKYPMAFWTNASLENYDGHGFQLKKGEQKIVINSDLQAAKDILLYTIPKINDVRKIGITSLEKDKNMADRLIRDAENSFMNKYYSKSLSLAQEALAKCRDLYINTRKIIEDSGNAITFISFIIIPFALLAERLFFEKYGLKRVILTLLLYITPLVILWPAHPGFSLSSSPLMILVGFVVLLLLLLPLSVVVSLSIDFLNKLRIKTFGVHRVETSKSAILLTSSTLGIRQMKKRSQRTTLLLMSIILITVSSVIFSSITGLSIISPISLTIKGTYNGILVRMWGWGGLLRSEYDVYTRGATFYQIPPNTGERLYEELKVRFADKAIIVPRAWAYLGSPVSHPHFTLNESGIAFAKETHAILGLCPEEENLTINGLRDLISGRWFTMLDNDERMNVAIISSRMAKAFNITPEGLNSDDPPKIIYAGGYKYTVIGILNDTAFYNYAKDLDGLPVTPFDIKALPSLDRMVPPEETIIIPFKTLLKDYDGFIVSCAIKFKPEYSKESTILEAAKEIYESTKYYLWVSYEGKVWAISYLSKVVLMGWETQFIPLIIAALTVMSIFLATLQERENEIKVFSIVGSSPLHLSFQYLVESLCLFTIGTTLGLVIGIFSGYIYNSIINVEPKMMYFTTGSVNAIIIVMLALLVASLYPSIKSARLVTPSLERKWRIPQPSENEWIIPLPFTIKNDQEAEGLISFILEFLQSHLVSDAEVFQCWNVSREEKDISETNLQIKSVNFECKIRPYELNIYQKVSFNLTKNLKTNYYSVDLKITLTMGPRESWVIFNRAFIDLFRKQMLLWRTLEAGRK